MESLQGGKGRNEYQKHFAEDMWYVMQVVSGKEIQTVLMLERTLSAGVLEGSFIPIRRLKKKYHGEWKEITEKLFPGYVFLISSQPRLLYDELKNIPALTKLLGNCEEYFTALSKTDVRFLQKLQGIQNGFCEVGLSQVVVGEGRQIRIVSGPLKSLEGQIRKINLHKRIAVVSAEFMESRALIHLGIEIIDGRL